MNNLSQQRLVGFLVLLALGVVFWPIIFVEAPDAQLIVMEPMPARPEVDRTPITPPESPAAAIRGALPTPDANTPEQQAADAATRVDEAVALPEEALAVLPTADTLDPPVTRATAPAEPVLDAQGLGVAWVLQVATVSSRQRADTLVARLSDRGYKAFLRPLKRGSDELYRVQIGPNVERAKLERIRPEIDRVLAVESAILRYTQ